MEIVKVDITILATGAIFISSDTKTTRILTLVHEKQFVGDVKRAKLFEKNLYLEIQLAPVIT